MTETTEEIQIAEKYLKEMLEADDAGDFDLFTKRYEKKFLADFTRERFANDIQHMHERNGMHTGYEYLGSLRNSRLNELDVY